MQQGKQLIIGRSVPRPLRVYITYSGTSCYSSCSFSWFWKDD